VKKPAGFYIKERNLETSILWFCFNQSESCKISCEIIIQLFSPHYIASLHCIAIATYFNYRLSLYLYFIYSFLRFQLFLIIFIWPYTSEKSTFSLKHKKVKESSSEITPTFSLHRKLSPCSAPPPPHSYCLHLILCIIFSTSKVYPVVYVPLYTYMFIFYCY